MTEKHDDAEPNSIEEIEAINFNPCVDLERVLTQEKLDEAVKRSIEKHKHALIVLSSR